MKNKGRQQYRFKQNPLEKRFAEFWKKYNSDRTGRLDGRGVLDYIMSENPNRPSGEVTDRDRMVAATVIQWLGSPVGQGFIKESMGIVVLAYDKGHL